MNIIENKDFISVDRVLGFVTRSPKTLNFILKYNLHIALSYLVFTSLIIIFVSVFFKRTVIKKYHTEHKLLNDKYNDLLEHLEEENDFNSKITKLEDEIKVAFKEYTKFTEDSVMVKYVATGEFLFNKYKDTNAMEPSAIANCYVKAFERIVMVSAYGAETFEKQDDTKSSYVGMLTKEMMKIDFTKSAKEVHNLVRALTGTAFLGEKRVKIYKTLVRDDRGEAGKILSLSPFVVACGEGAVEIAEIQPEGKKRMLAKDFANGLKNMEIKELKFS